VIGNEFGSINTELLAELPGHLVRGRAATTPALSLRQLDEAIGQFHHR
jgi:putative transposase